ncbi:hypothetical protein H6G41_06030 [Tolypothrix sp. FACHB-123]|uniref:hypothetical protein n=1 Tax=Tolypothrix sp. FACHB-123 TaxID=2692868 RepID=UPI001684381F|nr:hypothetical protein [Tolypothrix sp. FACHB-123]MBD2354186.1 hypothetical protein [Tolypothrix sp. FACHB-123]
MRSRQFIYILFVISLVGILGFSYISEKPIGKCYKRGFISSNNQKYYIYPEKIVIQPWRGQHHVYGIFMIPNGYEHDYLLQFQLPDNSTYCGTVYYSIHNVLDGIKARPDNYLVKGYVNTRLALWLMIQGKLDHLQQPSNWSLGYVRKE